MALSGASQADADGLFVEQDRQQCSLRRGPLAGSTAEVRTVWLKCKNGVGYKIIHANIM
jgi:hypothetical protein